MSMGIPSAAPKVRRRCPLVTALAAWGLLGAAALPARQDPNGPQPIYPGADWTERSPAAAGLDPQKLQALSEYIGGRGCVVRGGCLVYGWGDLAKRGDIASACKPWYVHFLLAAWEQGKIASLDEPVVRWEPRLNDLNPSLGHKDRQITWRHLANQISCYGVQEKPGTAFCYNDWQMALFWDTLVLRVYSATYDDVDEKLLHARLTDILQCQDKPTFLAFGGQDRPGRVAVSVRDFCRFGLLYLRRGNWNGRQLLRAKHVDLATGSSLPNSLPRAGQVEAQMIPGQRSIGSRRIPDNQTDHGGSYSFAWWTNGVDRQGKRQWPGVPTGAYGAFGHGGMRAMVVIGELDLIISWNDSRIEESDKEAQALRLLVEAVTDR
ncbi:MAG: serine hydrolase [Sedimentisphaerales bacterium]|nr:serine hydrolase [Sedimentisphaerales bacterium]